MLCSVVLCDEIGIRSKNDRRLWLVSGYVVCCMHVCKLGWHSMYPQAMLSGHGLTTDDRILSLLCTDSLLS